jgi:hypothetical protein
MSARASAYAKGLVVCPNGERISRGEKLVLIVLADNHQDKARHFTYPSLETISEDALCDRRSCQRYLAALESKGVIRRLRPANQGRGMQVFYFFAELDEIPEGWQNAALFEGKNFAQKGGGRAAEGRHKGGILSTRCIERAQELELELKPETTPPYPLAGEGAAMESVREDENAEPEETDAEGVEGNSVSCAEDVGGVIPGIGEIRDRYDPRCDSSDLRDAETADLTSEQWESVHRAAPRDQAGWEAYYREENQRVAEQQWKEAEKAKRFDGLKRELCSLQAATEWVMRGCGFEDDGRKRGVWKAICDVLRSRSARGCPLWDVAPAMVAAWLDYQRIGAMLATQYGAVKFFRMGIWEKRSGWRIDAKKAEMQGASVGS